MELYSRVFTYADVGSNVNTATIDETGQSDDATVTVSTSSLTATLLVEKKIEGGIDSHMLTIQYLRLQ